MRVRMAVMGAVAAALVGCGSNSDCNITPDLSQAPSSCALAPSTSVTVYARWCSCNATTVCQVTTDFGNGVVQLEPKVSSCDASCEPNPSSCAFDTVPCTFTTPASGTYTLYFSSGLGTVNRPLTIGGGDDSCGPT